MKKSICGVESITIVRKYAKSLQFVRNRINRIRLKNKVPTLICNNCAGGILYKYLGLQFRSPFIATYMTNEDFIYALEHFNAFLKSDITEDITASESYPVGVALDRIRIHFVHYKSFKEAVGKWNVRKERINPNNMAVMITDFEEKEQYLARFAKLPFKYKYVFSENLYSQYPFVVYLKGYKEHKKKMKTLYDVGQIWHTKNHLTGKRFIDDFDYVGLFNTMLEQINNTQ